MYALSFGLWLLIYIVKCVIEWFEALIFVEKQDKTRRGGFEE
jgi:hypothetical protein